ncbi:MAG TPA: right-handed parallel beta-helix repeat-containing protein [Gaiellaceae bacterium]|nr:right-handed parallel beta-helix repeat-containing protein [Gaiellaceae bacterium]
MAFALVAGLVLVFGNAASGQSTTIFTVPACNSVVSQNTTLTGDMSCSGTLANALTIGAPGITLNLNGHTITGNGSYACVYVYEYNNVTINGGTFAGCEEGVYIEYAADVTVSNNKSSGSSTVEYGVYADYSGITVKGNSFVDPSSQGVSTEYDGGDTITKNTVTFTSTTSSYGFEDEYGNTNTYSNNTVTGPTGGSSYGFYMYETASSQLLGNSVTGGEYGYYVECDEYATANLNGNGASDTSSDGFYIYECENFEENYNDPTVTQVVNNVATNAGGYGIDDYYNTNAIYSGNTANGNDDGGFYFEESPGEVITGNTANKNDGDGFYFEADYNYYAPKTVSKNTANKNDGYGFSDDDYPVAASKLSGSGNDSGCTWNIIGC